MDKLLVIVTGPERNGTTYLSQLIYSIPNIYSGFDTGLLLNNDFSKCKPFCDWIYNLWGVPRNIDFFSPKLTFKDKYNLLFKYKGTINNSQYNNLIRNSNFIVDKTPRYFENLNFVRKNSNNIPIIITIKYFKDLFISRCVKRNTTKGNGGCTVDDIT